MDSEKTTVSIPIKIKEEHNRGEGAVNCPGLVIRSNLVTQVGLDMPLCRDVNKREPFEDAVDGGLCGVVVGYFLFCTV